MNNISKEDRSKIMAAIKSRNTKPEKIVRSLLFSLGYRFRLHVKNLPGSPDIVLRKYNTVIFVNGCFWHQHKNCKLANIPKTNLAYWLPKIERNLKRDRKNISDLRKRGWKVIILWECQVENTPKLSKVFTKII